MKYALFCRGECGRVNAYIKRPPGSVLRYKYFGFCDECKWMIKWGGGVKEQFLLSPHHESRTNHLMNHTDKAGECYTSFLRNKFLPKRR